MIDVLNAHRNIVAPIAMTACFLVAWRLWIEYKAEMLRRRVASILRMR